ncbi:DUF3322 domain-containing protein [Acidithiobacillus sp.]|uniref:DUF3322 domain-containing protein n=1 Tax=Acidithiobacillus sp. TaxID=1872118 RepID=UPI002619290D|nr:DUF3322 domain-containing protein [Acidithiobacillus sp.]
MNWTSAADVRKQLQRLWERGELLRALTADAALFPLRLTLKNPNSAELPEQFAAVRDWICTLTATPKIRIEWRETRHRVLGVQRLPAALWVDTADDALALISKQPDARRFLAIWTSTAARHPALLDWLHRKPLQALDYAAVWPQLLAVLDWVADHPRPGIYLRQVDIPGIHSKFVEAHRTVLSELCDALLPAEAIAPEYRGVSQFAARYGFLDKTLRIRFRLLDARITLLPGTCCPDITLDAASFSTLDLPVRRVFITENETNFLAFPRISNAIVIFGAGYGWDALSQAHWLGHCTLHYWGDIDTHGFAILDQLRKYFPQVQTLLMDEATLMAHRDFWGEEDKPTIQDLPRLTESERVLYDILRDNRLRPGLRLEQERIRFGRLQDAIAAFL